MACPEPSTQSKLSSATERLRKAARRRSVERIVGKPWDPELQEIAEETESEEEPERCLESEPEREPSGDEAQGVEPLAAPDATGIGACIADSFFFSHMEEKPSDAEAEPLAEPEAADYWTSVCDSVFSVVEQMFCCVSPPPGAALELT